MRKEPVVIQSHNPEIDQLRLKELIDEELKGIDVLGFSLNLDDSDQGGPCGQWVTEDGQRVIEMVASGHGTLKDHE